MPAPSKYNWLDLKKEYLVSNDVSVVAFCKRKDLPAPSENNYVAKMTSGWSGDKENVQKRALQIYAEQVSEDMLTDTKAIRLEQAKAARLAAKKAIHFILDKANAIKSIEEARKLYETTTKIQNAALGISEKLGAEKNLTQINIIDSKFGNLLEEGNVEEIVGLLGAVRTARREHSNPVGEFSEQAAREEIIGESR